MIHETVSLGKGEKVTLTTYIHDQSEQERFQIEKRPAIIIMPGGAYSYLADAEGEPVALTFLKEGYNTFAIPWGMTAHTPRSWRRFPWRSGRCGPMRKHGMSIRTP